MENITYFIGAGASANALPLYCNFQQRLEVFRDFIYHHQKEKPTGIDTKTKYYLEILQSLIDNLDTSNTSTLDLLAHQLSTNRNSIGGLDFHHLKYLISDFFVFEQLQKRNGNFKTQEVDLRQIGGYKFYDDDICDTVCTAIDRRYGDFMLPEFIKQQQKLPQHINFISWNYDLQFELAYARIAGCSINLAQQKLQVFPSPETENGVSLRESCIIKINGTAGIYYNDNSSTRITNFVHEREFEMNDVYLDEMIATFYANRRRIFGGNPFFKFYFEDNNGNNEI